MLFLPEIITCAIQSSDNFEASCRLTHKSSRHAQESMRFSKSRRCVNVAFPLNYHREKPPGEIKAEVSILTIVIFIYITKFVLLQQSFACVWAMVNRSIADASTAMKLWNISQAYCPSPLSQNVNSGTYLSIKTYVIILSTNMSVWISPGGFWVCIAVFCLKIAMVVKVCYF